MPPHGKNEVGSPLLNATAGAIAAAIEISIDYPTEYTKTVMQLYPEVNKRGLINCVKDTVKKNGFFGLYRGYSALLVFGVPKNYVRFLTFTYFRQNIFKAQSRINTFLCGMTAGCMEALLVVTPMETIKVKLIHDKFREKPIFRNLFHGIYSICKQEGFSGIYKGVLATVLKQSSNQAIRFLVFEDTQKQLNKFIPWKFLADFLAGGFAGFVSVMANNPIDVVKTNMQGLEAKKFNGFIGCFIYIWKKEKFFGFYKGVTPRLMRVMLDVSLTFSIWNLARRILLFFVGNH